MGWVATILRWRGVVGGQGRESQQTKPEASSSRVPPVNAPTSIPAGGQLDPAAIMNHVIASPALDGLLSGVSNQTGIGSPDVLRNMLGQLTQNPAMMNTVNQIAQQIDGNQYFSNMFASMGGGGSSDGGSDLSEEVLSSVVEAAAHLNDNRGNADELSEICSAEGLAHEFMEMLKRDVSRRVEEEGE
ncbi:hypothetical protein L1987_76563 [Smallanthus sonchifolius]|uniref:Uncharacterized protein n=1 Tax=Smallanthus sonchifolius TaxID=185202 RepID=A0ACB8Z8L4_9ASTR|nr:hypothetical protein L1987_76563 [Smallanthus sonchifolius]